jgi:hypothetical protein
MSKTKDSKPQSVTPSSGADAADTQPETERPDLATAARKSAGKGVWTGAAVGIGSAAIVAALLYARKKS